MILAIAAEAQRTIAILAWNGILAIPGTIFFDQIIRHLYERRRDLWEAEKRPCGVLYRPPGARCGYTWSRSYGANWSLWTPEWMRDDPVCVQKLRLIRCLEVASVIGTLVMLFLPII